MSWNNRVIWTEGMFLRPQHFQQQDRHFQRWVESRCEGLRCYPWGVTRLEIEEPLLALGKFAIRSIHGIFPDGTPFKIPEDHSPPTALDIPDTSKNEVIHLALPIHRYDRKEITHDSDGDPLSRLRVQELETKDIHSDLGAGSEVIQCGELSTQLRLNSQDHGGFVTIPIARIIERKADSQVVLDDHFIPTILHCAASHRLAGYIREIQGMLRHRSEALAQQIGSPGAGGVAEIVDFLLLQITNRYVPLFNHLAGLQQLHPESLYRIMLQLAGELATITAEDRQPDAFPPYIHEQLTPSFEPVIAAIRNSLNWMGPRRAVPIPLEAHKHGIYTGAINDPQLIASAAFVLAVNAQVSVDKLQRNFPHQVTIATVDKLRDLVMTHTPGIAIHSLAAAPRQIRFHAGFSYFELDKNNALWKELAKTGTIAMHFAGDYPELELEFWAIRG